MSATRSWGQIFDHYKRLGADPSDAAYRADQWEKRQDANRWAKCCSTHCERRQECASPHDCTASVTGVRP